MAQTQPPTTGKVVLHTTKGDLDIELWCKETPKTCRNFIQLCMEGYYNNTIFHRLIKGFMIQGGDPTGKGTEGESIYGGKFQDEFHQRLKFNYRGLVAMANTGVPNDNGSQFFITFDQCEWLNKKHTIFGKVIGNTIYNLQEMQDLETNDVDRPIDPPKILSADNYFDDIVPRNLNKDKLLYKKDDDEEESSDEDEETKKKREELIRKAKQKLKPKKNNNLLSFEDDDEEEEEEEEENQEFQKPQAKNQKKGIVSSHDVVDNEVFSKEYAVDLEEIKQLYQIIFINESLSLYQIFYKKEKSEKNGKTDKQDKEQKIERSFFQANTGVPNDNGSQFFITFDQCEWLNKKHTIFGKVIGNTIYNLQEMQDLETNDVDRPIDPPKILSADIIQNYFDDIVPRNLNKDKLLYKKDDDEEESSDEDEETKKKREELIRKAKQKLKPKKNNNLLSFEDDDEEEEEEEEENQEFQKPQAKNQKKGIVSSHDVVDNEVFSKEYAVDLEEIKQVEEKNQQKIENLKNKLKRAGKNIDFDQKSKKFMSNEGEALKKLVDQSSNKDIKGYKTRKNEQTGKLEFYWDSQDSNNSDSDNDSSESSSDSDDYENEEQKKIRQKQKEEYENLKLDVLKFKSAGLGSKTAKIEKMIKDEKKLQSNLEKRKQKYIKQKEEEKANILGKLDEFKKKLQSKDVKSKKNSWLNHIPQFHIDSRRAYEISEKKNKSQDIVSDSAYRKDKDGNIIQ
ncbi:Cyclophilin-like peptidyl-prolyl cis-trans isomerase domain [Pseudocohnilembus persalinus]|uniref:Cyclophilin-like peptidyl-prolyl cis-trans isomerase domain n=1 Tax=Pseudocohnilembus persalinus TaxID=266149 RepID=A0A0V0Q7R0_PSEPJ|nr:Cyclophilin-like peptidyl-prolyl cis-trans isomerase domain [Pseudocohnilembus persalinus]|eukprot:KRW98209.1 Cyclophilin-like peptidyl-prolyl cis-trans isomerase domain [Pseudocohnilembus persalinus]